MKFHSALSINRSMVIEPSLVLYSCISKGTTVLADFNSTSGGDQDLGNLALQCLEHTPHYHRTFAHTAGNRIYAFLIEDPFVYFAIFVEKLGKPQAFQFLSNVKDGFLKLSKKHLAKALENNPKPHCLQDEFSSVFRRLLASNELRSSKSPEASVAFQNQNGGGLEPPPGKKVISTPLLGGKINKHTKKKKKNPIDEIHSETRDIAIENKVDVSDDVNLTREFSASLQKNGSYIGHTGRHHAKKMWRRHVWTVLLIDLVICCVLFGVWLCICKGFECVS